MTKPGDTAVFTPGSVERESSVLIQRQAIQNDFLKQPGPYPIASFAAL